MQVKIVEPKVLRVWIGCKNKFFIPVNAFIASCAINLAICTTTVPTALAKSLANLRPFLRPLTINLPNCLVQLINEVFNKPSLTCANASFCPNVNVAV